MLVADAMNKNVKVIRPDANVREAAKIMSDARIGSLIVLSSAGAIVGIITEHDIMADVVAQGKDSEKTKVSEVMTENVLAISPDITLEAAADVMTKNKIKKLPVIKDGALVGIITASDLITYEKRLIEKIATLIAASPQQTIGG